MNEKEKVAFEAGWEDAHQTLKAAAVKAVEGGKHVGKALNATRTSRLRKLRREWVLEAAGEPRPVRKLRDNGAAGRPTVRGAVKGLTKGVTAASPRLTKAGKRIGRPPKVRAEAEA